LIYPEIQLLSVRDTVYKDNTMIFKTPTLGRQDEQVIAKIIEAKASLGYALHVPRRWTGLLRRSTLGRAIRGSNSIEGYRIGKEDVVAAAVGEVVEGNDDTRQATESYRRAMTYVLRLTGEGDFAWSTQVIKSLHYMMLEHAPDKNPGKWRPGQIFVIDEDKNETVYEGPNFEVVPSLMDELVEALTALDERMPTLIAAAMAHLNLTMIHPFSDGNGRMARCLQTLVLGRGGTLEPTFSSIEEYLGRNHRAYYDILATVGRGNWHPEHDARPWVQFCLRAHYYQAHTLLRRMRESERTWTTLEAQVTALGLPERMVFALWDAAQGFKVRNGTYRPAADISEQSASKDLRILVEAGLLEAHGAKRGRFYLATPKILEVQRDAAEDRVIADPYGDASVPLVLATTTSTTTTLQQPSMTPSSTGPLPPSGQSPRGGSR
jgi:Fic family protein